MHFYTEFTLILNNFYFLLGMASTDQSSQLTFDPLMTTFIPVTG